MPPAGENVTATVWIAAFVFGVLVGRIEVFLGIPRS
jgi:hypothetical protein